MRGYLPALVATPMQAGASLPAECFPALVKGVETALQGRGALGAVHPLRPV